MTLERAQRAAVVRIARQWIGTPYHHRAMLKGVAADCVTFILATYQDAGLLGAMALPDYSPQWHLNQGGELYLEALAGRFVEIPGPPQPGDLVLWRFGRSFSHGAIAIEWPLVIHALWGACVQLDDASRANRLTTVGLGEPGQGKPRPTRFFSYWHDAGHGQAPSP
jgi:cell wall-associated NlpC family hydrolase